MKKITNLFGLQLILISTFLLSNVFVYSQKTDTKINVVQYVLPNGLTVILNEDHTKSEIFGLVVTRAGGKDDPADATGMAHYMEHMLFKGTEELGTSNWEEEKPYIENIFALYDRLGETKDEAVRTEIQKQINEESIKANEFAIPNELSNIIKEIGGTGMNANTSPDRTVFFNTFPSNQLEKWLEIYSHRFVNAVFRSFQAELEVVYEEKNLYSDMFQTRLIENFQSHFFKNHPYGQQTLIGTIEDLKNPSLTKMYDFYKTYYVANNMALILSGDFNTTDAKKLIEKKFGNWRSGNIPERKIYYEDPFNGREFVKVKLSPIKIGLLGFRTVASGHPDQIALEVCNQILSNSNQTGLLDKLVLDNKILAAMTISMPYYDHGATLIFIVPKIVGQKLESAEELVMTEIRKLRNGEFDDWVIGTVKNSLYVDYMLSMEDNRVRALKFGESFGQGRKIESVLEYPNRLKKITRDDVIEIAQKYYGENYLAFYSKMGFPKKEKIDKPDYDPIVSKNELKSVFANKLESIPSKKPKESYFFFEEDVTKEEIYHGVNLFYTKNPLNEIFSMTLKYGIGDVKLPDLKYVSELMNYAGTKNYSVSEFKEEFAKIGCNYSISSDDSYLTINIEGLEKNLKSAVLLINGLINNPVIEDDKLNILYDGEKTNRKMERSEPDNVADALFEFVKYKSKSKYLDRLSLKEVKKLKTKELIKTFKNATNFELNIHIAAQQEIKSIISLFQNTFKLKETIAISESPIVKNAETYKENTIYFVNKKNATQSKVYFFGNGKNFKKENEAYIDAFNLYFGGGFSGIVLQEIREYRSLAYSAGSKYTIPALEGKPSEFIGYVGTQADKTNEAINIFYDLIRNMPEKPDRINMIRTYLNQKLSTDKPDFRNLSETIEAWKLKGYNEDPAIMKSKKYETLEFESIIEFYNENVRDIPIVIAIVGDEKKIDMKKLEQFGKVVKIKEKELFRK